MQETWKGIPKVFRNRVQGADFSALSSQRDPGHSIRFPAGVQFAVDRGRENRPDPAALGLSFLIIGFPDMLGKPYNDTRDLIYVHF